MKFTTNYEEILKKIDTINPLDYSQTRNYTDGDITYLSPYISRGVISIKQVSDTMFAKGYSFADMEKFIQQLAWREFFQRTWQYLEDDVLNDIRRSYTGIKHRNIPAALLSGNTGINCIDKAINQLYQTGYMHNHIRLYVASIACNIGKAYWQMPSQWMYYHLLDGDIASNACSWQWVAGSFSSKQYFCNQDNINKYTYSAQRNTFLDRPYDELPEMEIPAALNSVAAFNAKTNLPVRKEITIDPALPLLIYNSYNLDPLWRKDEKANRILLLEPGHFRDFPVSDKVIEFILALAKNIEGLQVFTGEVNEIPHLKKIKTIYSKEHPAFIHYPGKKDERDWLFPEVKGQFNSFFSFWKKCLQSIERKDAPQTILKRA
jgi:deoxyribodipyrimidine photo-lyase